jgi:hypothetical protein
MVQGLSLKTAEQARENFGAVHLPSFVALEAESAAAELDPGVIAGVSHPTQAHTVASSLVCGLREGRTIYRKLARPCSWDPIKGFDSDRPPTTYRMSTPLSPTGDERARRP